MKSRVKLISAVRTKEMRGKLYYTARIKVRKLRETVVHMERAFSVEKLGKYEARLAAALQRMCWLLEYGVWKPSVEGTMHFSDYLESFSGNSEYENCLLEDIKEPILSPQFIRRRESQNSGEHL